MFINNITITKSKTVGVITPDGRTRYNKIIISASAALTEADDEHKSYEELSAFIEEQFKYEKTIK